jgi:hypothetical protein
MRYRFAVDGRDVVDTVHVDCTTAASSVFDMRLPAQRAQAMALLADKIAQHVRSNLPDDVPPLLPVAADDDSDGPAAA